MRYLGMFVWESYTQRNIPFQFLVILPLGLMFVFKTVHFSVCKMEIILPHLAVLLGGLIS